MAFCVLLPKPLQWNVFSQQAKLKGEREIVFLMTTLNEKLCYAQTKPICFKVQSDTAMHTLIMLTYSNYVASFLLIKL